MDIRDVLSADSLRAIERLGRLPAHKPQKQRPKKTVLHQGKILASQRRKELPLILGVIQSVGCDTVYIEDRSGMIVLQGLVIAHWTEDELNLITMGIEERKYVFKKTWRNTWAVVIC